MQRCSSTCGSQLPANFHWQISQTECISHRLKTKVQRPERHTKVVNEIVIIVENVCKMYATFGSQSV